MHSPRSARFEDHFADITDPRRRKVVYPLINIVVIAICAVIAGADDFVSIAEWGRQQRDWLSRTSTAAVAGDIRQRAHDRRDGLPDGNCRDNRQRWGRLCTGGEGQSADIAWGDRRAFS
jgi:DDE_Tnp_1-associated